MKHMLNKEFECNFVDSENEEGGENGDGDEDDDLTPTDLIE